jgi:SOS-response transcriptional repressor LexA
MGNMTSFGEVLEAADKLSMEEQETLIDILHRRMIERRRAELARDIRETQKEFQEGKCKPVTPDKLMKEVLS